MQTTRSSMPAFKARVCVRALVGLCAGLLALGALAQDAAPTPAELAQKLREQQQALEKQRQELERQRAEIERQQRQLEALAASLEAQQRAAAEKAAPPAAPGATGSASAASTGRGLHFSGYADMSYQRFDFYENAQTVRPIKRGRTDLQRFILAPRMDFGRGWSFFGEIEFEHGGTGATVEFEAEEAGEFETEVEKGGEIVLEQLYLQYSLNPQVNFRFGELVVPVGMVNSYHQPTEYFTIERSLGETSMLPVVWHETGVQMLGTIGQARYQLQLVTALDSTGFSGYGFVANGMQSKLEFKNASAFAIVAQGEYAFAPGMLLGAAYYQGDSAPNRPRQNLDVPARVSIAEVHGRYEVGPVIVRGQAMQGRLQNAEAVSQANLNTFNGGVLGTSRTPVGSRSESYFIEAGYDLLSLFQATQYGRLDAFARYDRYDTHAATQGSITRVARYARKAATLGLNWKPQPGLVFKGEYSRRTNESTVGADQDFLGLGLGFEF